MSGRRTVLRVYCGACTSERRKRPELVGTVVSHRPGSLSWRVTDNRRKRLDAGRVVPPPLTRLVTEAHLAGIPLRDDGNSQVRPPASLFAYCKRHGRGVVLSADVRGRHGSVVLNLIAMA